MPRNLLKIENAKIFWTNFAGKERENNPAGKRNFCVEIPEDIVKNLKADGWNVKYTKDSEEYGGPKPYIQVEVKYGDYPPKIYKVTSRNKTLLDEDVVGDLDTDEITNVDLYISPYHWTVGSKSGIKAYVDKMWVTIEEDDLTKKYANYDDEESLPFGE